MRFGKTEWLRREAERLRAEGFTETVIERSDEPVDVVPSTYDYRQGWAYRLFMGAG